MIGRILRTSVLFHCLVFALHSRAAAETTDDDLNGSRADAKAIEGLWEGAWGGGGSDGVEFQPVIAELLIVGDRVELDGFRNVSRLSGTFRLNPAARQMEILPAATDDNKRLPIIFTYNVKGDELTLTDSDSFPISLAKENVSRNIFGDVSVEFVESSGIDEAGDLLVTKYHVLQTSLRGTKYFGSVKQTLETKQATVRVVQETGYRQLTIDEARKLIRGPTPLVVMYRDDGRPDSNQFHKLWKDVGSPAAESEAVWRTLSRTLRPGTLVFIVEPKRVAPP